MTGERRPRGIAAGLALTLVLAVVAAQAISIGLFTLTRPPRLPLVSPAWIAERIGQALDDALAAPPEARTAALARHDDPWFTFEWRLGGPATDATEEQDGRGEPFGFVREHLAAALGERARQVRLMRPEPPFFWRLLGLPRPPTPGPPPGPPPGQTAGQMAGQPPAVFDPARATVPAMFRIEVETAAGFRLVAQPTGASASALRPLLEFALWIALIGLAVALLAWWAARRLTVPLARLAAEADRLGRDLGGPPVAETGPQETRVIAQALNDMGARLRRFVDDRTEMVAAMSHDLRTPLTRLRLLAEAPADPATRRRMLAEIDAMQAMIAETLAFMAGDARPEPRQRVDLAALAASICDDASDAGHRACYAGPERLVYPCQPGAMRRALANIVDNAIEYGGGAEVTLSSDPDAVAIAVADEGPGIAAAHRELVFRPFYRVEESRNRATGGVGLGLAVARSVARAHGGDVTLAPRVPAGLVVTVTLPPLAGRTAEGGSPQR